MLFCHLVNLFKLQTTTWKNDSFLPSEMRISFENDLQLVDIYWSSQKSVAVSSVYKTDGMKVSQSASCGSTQHRSYNGLCLLQQALSLSMFFLDKKKQEEEKLRKNKAR